MAVSDGYREFVMDQLGQVLPVHHRRMFGSVGIYTGDLFFALISGDTLFFKVDQVNLPDYQAAHMEGFDPYGEKRAAFSYYSVPVEVLEDTDELHIWAAKAVDAAERVRAMKGTKKRKKAE